MAKELAEAASRAKDRFLAVLSHELRTPLTPVLIAVSSMLESNPDPALLPALEMIRRNIELEARLIDDLLDLSRIVRGRLRLDLEVVDIHQVIRRAVEICRDEMLVAGLDVLTELKARHHHVMADHARIMQVDWNLIHNAAKFTPAGGRLTIRTTNPPGPTEPAGPLGAEPAPHLVVEFDDTGIGIAPEILPRIFERVRAGPGRPARPFPRAGAGAGDQPSRSPKRWAAGSRRSSAGRRAGLDLPPGADDGSCPGRHERHAGRGSTRRRPIASAPAAGLRILLVEDNQDTLRFLATVLRRRGHEVVTADCLAAARAAVDRAERPLRPAALRHRAARRQRPRADARARRPRGTGSASP